MALLQGFQKRYLRSLAHARKPVVFVGQKGLTPTLAGALEEALDHHELVKVKFVDFKEKEKKTAMAETIAARMNCEVVGMIGHMVTFYRQQRDPEKRRITVPRRASDMKAAGDRGQ
jgi:RNA-binding protein